MDKYRKIRKLGEGGFGAWHAGARVTQRANAWIPTRRRGVVDPTHCGQRAFCGQSGALETGPLLPCSAPTCGAQVPTSALNAEERKEALREAQVRS